MTQVFVKLPVFAFPIKDADNPCPCQDRPMELTYKQGQIFWDVRDGEQVEKGAVIASLEVEKKTLEIESPAAGRIHLQIESGAPVDSHVTLAIIEVTDD